MIKLSNRSQLFESSKIRALFDAAATLKDPISFAIGQPDFGPTEKVKQAAIDAINSDQSKYTPTQGIKPLREKISQKLKAENNILVDPENIIVTPGTSAAFFLTLSTILNPNDEVIIPEPYFVEYPIIVKFLDAKPVFLDTFPDNFQINIEKLKSLITEKTRMIILNTPNNPSGAVYPKETLEQIAKIAEENNLVIVADEIYEKFIYDGEKPFSIGSIYENTITLNGLSKSGGMPGWRLAWASGPSEVIQKMKDLQQYIFVQAPSTAQYAALAAFTEEEEISQNYQQKRELAIQILSKKYKLEKPQGAFYIMLEVGDEDKFTQWALSQNILVVPGSAFSDKTNFVRLSYALSKDKIEQGITKLLEY